MIPSIPPRVLRSRLGGCDTAHACSGLPVARYSPTDLARGGALADGTRRAIVSRLADGPQAVGQLAAGLPVSRSAVSQHLKVLKDAGLVSERAAGTRRVYRLNPAAVAALRDPERGHGAFACKASVQMLGRRRRPRRRGVSER